MRQFGPPELVLDWSEFGHQQVLREALQSGEPQVTVSPDKRHLFLLLPHKLLSFPRLLDQAPLNPASYLEKTWAAHTPPLAGLLFPRSSDQAWVLTLVWESGRAEVWSPPTARSGKGWTLLQILELCNSPRARVASVCVCGGDLVWCEERPSSEAKQPAALRTSQFNYCICQRSLELHGEQSILGGMKIVLHHSPLYNVMASARHVCMVPSASIIVPQLLLIYSPLEDKISISSTSSGLIHIKNLSEGESDFKKMVFECLGFMSFTAPAETRSSAVTESGDLLLVSTNGDIDMLHPDGTVRHICDFRRSINNDTKVRMQIYGGILACALDTSLYLIDLNTGRQMEKCTLSTDDLCFVKFLETDDIQLLTKTGIYIISYYGSNGFIEENGKCEPALLEMVFEEACKYYQRRSLSSAKLTVNTLKKEGIFQAPIALSSIVNSYQKDGKSKDPKYADLSDTMSSELQSYLSLEVLKSHIINAPGNLDQYCEDLIDQEIHRLLHTDLDRDNLVYINSLFNMFPKPAWKSLRNNLQFQQNGDGKLVIRATSDLWKKVLSTLSSGPKENCHNGVSPLFEVICQSLYTFKPKWLPGFVQQAQEYAGLSCYFSNKENCEGAPLYKRALSVLSKKKNNTTIDLEIEILLCSGRPQAIIQAIHVLISLQQWERVMTETRKFSKLSPIITKDIFITLLIEFVKNRHLDSYINELYEICPDDMTVTDILRIVLQTVPKIQGDHLPFSCNSDAHLTVGSLKPLLNKVLQNQSRQDQRFSASSYPPSTPQRTHLASDNESAFVNGDSLATDMSYVTDIYATNTM
ncbi:BLOC-2 complex member HPS6 [Discoglossus pictus]